jgi:peptidoglycan-N-acetylglucosamine deacetylase
MFYTVPSPVRKLTRNWVTWDKPPGNKTIFLTFDDGPDPGVTPQVLDILRQFQARATFFVSGSKALIYPDIIEKTRLQGHAIGNHGFGHLRGFATPAGKYLEDVEKCAAIVKSRLFRPPFGSLGPLQAIKLRRLGYEICMWSVISRDYDPAVSQEQCLVRCLKHIRDGSIVLFHDSQKAARNCLYVLPRLLHHFSEKACRFEALGDG